LKFFSLAALLSSISTQSISCFYLKNGKAQKEEKQLMDCVLIDDSNAARLKNFNLAVQALSSAIPVNTASIRFMIISPG
jgi:hypothetical protein